MALSTRATFAPAIYQWQKGLSEDFEAPEPSLDKQSGETIYRVRCALSNGQDFSMLENGWLDSFGIMWSTGFEDYTVYDVDFMQRQLRCLNHD